MKKIKERLKKAENELLRIAAENVLVVILSAIFLKSGLIVFSPYLSRLSSAEQNTVNIVSLVLVISIFNFFVKKLIIKFLKNDKNKNAFLSLIMYIMTVNSMIFRWRVFC